MKKSHKFLLKKGFLNAEPGLWRFSEENSVFSDVTPAGDFYLGRVRDNF
jgi:hypothetical protein